MKKVVLYIGLLCMVINTVCGLVLSAYSTFNCTLTCSVIILNMVVMFLVSILTLKDGYRISLNVLFPFLFVGEFVCGLFSPEQWKDNWFIIILALMILVEGVILIITNYVSKNF